MSDLLQSWWLIDDVDNIDSPALVLYTDRVKKNVQALVNMVEDTSRLRPHAKTHKCTETTKLLLKAGVTKFKCATIAEAEMLAEAGAPDVLLAYQPVGPKIKRLLALAQKYPATLFSCLSDNVESLREMEKIFGTVKQALPVYIDLNTGMNRSGTPDAGLVLRMYEAAANMKWVKMMGLHAYDGHIRDADFAQRTQRCNEAYAQIEKLKDELVKKGFPEPVIIAGGSPTFPIHAKRKNMECSPGTFVYWDKGYADLCPEQPFIPAAVVLARVISLPTATRLCIDMGHKSISAENEISRRVYFLNAPELEPVSQSEEHLVVEAGANHAYQVGDVLYGLPIHVCPTVALYERAVTVEGGKKTGEWKTVARDRTIIV